MLIFKDKVLIYESLNKHVIDINDTLFRQVAHDKTYQTTQNEYEVVAVNIEQAGASYTVIASAYD